jgi:hypothetical protein
MVARYLGCLGNLPDPQRELLELRTGLGVPQPLGPAAAAARMHLGLARFKARERQALHELRGAASTHACTQVAGVAAHMASLIAAALGGAGHGGTPTGGVEAARYAADPSRPAGESSTLGSLLGTNIPPVASDAALVLLLALGMGLAVLLLMGDAIGLGPRHQHWRQTMAARMRRVAERTARGQRG